MPLVDRLPALSSRDFRNYLLGGFVSNVGNALQATAVAWHVWILTESPLMVGLLGLVRVGPMLTFSLFGGVLADQADRRRVMLVTQTGLAALAAALAVMEYTGHATVGLIYLIVALIAVCRAFDGPARQALVVSLVPTKHFPNAASLNGTTWRLSDVTGPILAGELIARAPVPAVSGLTLCYAINALSFVAVLYAIWILPPRPPLASGDARPESVRDVFALIGDGIRFVRKTPVVRNAMWIDFWATFFSAADALLPAFAAAVFMVGSQGFGVLAASSGIGALIAAACLAFLPTIRNQGRWVVSMIACYGLFTVLFGLSPNFWFAAVCLACTGAADMISTVLRQTIRQLATPDHMRGRMTGVSMLFHISGPQLGDFEAGAVAKFTGERASVVIGGAACLMIAAWYTRAPHLTGYKHAPDERAV